MRFGVLEGFSETCLSDLEWIGWLNVFCRLPDPEPALRPNVVSSWLFGLVLTCKHDSKAPSHIALKGLSLPHWLILLMLSAYPAVALIRGAVRRWRRPKHGLCVKCGYDLRGSNSEACPECGEPRETIIKR